MKRLRGHTFFFCRERMTAILSMVALVGEVEEACAWLGVPEDRVRHVLEWDGAPAD